MDESSDDEAPILVDLTAPTAGGAETAATAVATDDAKTESLPPCPVTILSGFLGSGKTTLVQHILKSPDHGKRIAVIENEFGEGLAVETLIARNGVDNNSLQEFIELPNGCICCTVKDSLVATLENLVAKKTDLDYILIEASGMANPGPIASVFWLDDALGSRLQLDGIVTVVDANNILRQLHSTEEAAQQIAYADRLIINKVDCLPDESSRQTVADITAALRKLHPTAPVITTSYSQVPDLDWILNANCFGGASRLEELDTMWHHAIHGHDGGPDDDHSQEGHSHSHSHDHDHGECHICQISSHPSHPPPTSTSTTTRTTTRTHRHTSAVTTMAFQHAGSVSLSKLNAWLAQLLWPDQDETTTKSGGAVNQTQQQQQQQPQQQDHSGMEIFRIKGIVSVVHDDATLLDADETTKYTTPLVAVAAAVGTTSKDVVPTGPSQPSPPPPLLDHRRYIIQAVHDLWEVRPASDHLNFDPGDERVGKVVMIGKHLPPHRLEHGFQSCFVTPSTGR